MAARGRWAGAALPLLLSGGIASAETPPLDAPVFLDGMRQMEQEVNTLHSGLLRDDHEAIRRAAAAIAASADPPMDERQRIMKRAGADVGRVSAMHGELRKTAGELAAAAALGDGVAVRSHHRHLMDLCLGCHDLMRANDGAATSR